MRVPIIDLLRVLIICLMRVLYNRLIACADNSPLRVCLYNKPSVMKCVVLNNNNQEKCGYGKELSVALNW